MALIEFKNLPDTDTAINAENLNNNFNETNGIDYTSQCEFTGCTLNAGKIYKIGKLVFVQVLITATSTYEWGTVIRMPNELQPIEIQDEGTPVVGAEYWVYSNDANYKADIRGATESGKQYSICGSYLAKN
jgi:hypothetical protein